MDEITETEIHLDDAPEMPIDAAATPEVGTGPSRNWTLIATGVALAALFAASQVYLISSLNSTQSQIESLDEQIDALGTSVDDVSVRVDDIASAATQAATAAASSASGGATPAPALPAGFLPRFSNDGPDQALGLKLGTVEGPDAYGGSTLSIDPADGTKRVWMIWAHWCPYCQQELPELNAWWPEAKDNFANAELVTITTSMDPSRGNPLEPYLESSQFQFPVVVDADTDIAAQMGVNAFPFWMVTDGDGTVLLRTAGALHIDQVEEIFSQLEDFEA
jgi:cytochrome c biogenesis protein CcmG/thiol:disulfide interchange protein DsbE